MTHGEKLPRIDAKLGYIEKEKAWRLANPEQHHAEQRRWRERYPNYFGEWRQGNPEKEREHRSKRRELEPVQLYFNQWFPGSHLHHMGDNYGIYLPEKLHRSIRHSLTEQCSMDAINWDALTWLAGERL